MSALSICEGGEGGEGCRVPREGRRKMERRLELREGLNRESESKLGRACFLLTADSVC